MRRCGRIAEIAVRATATTVDICVNCYRPPVAMCERCGRNRPCYHVAEGRPICATCFPRVDAELRALRPAPPPDGPLARGPGVRTVLPGRADPPRAMRWLRPERAPGVTSRSGRDPLL